MTGLAALAFLAILAAPTIAQASENTSEAALEAMLRPVDQQLLDAFPSGNRAAWARVIGPGFRYVAEDEQVIDGPTLLSLIKPAAPGPTDDWQPFRIRDWSVIVSGDMAVVVHHDEEQGTHFGSPLTGVDLTTETWRRIGTEWKLLLVHTTPIPTLPPIAVLRAVDLEELVGRYQAAGQVVTVAKDGDGLAWRPAGKPPVHLSPESRDVFFNTNPRQRTIFHRNKSGSVIGVFVRNENRAIAYQRLPNGSDRLRLDALR